MSDQRHSQGLEQVWRRFWCLSDATRQRGLGHNRRPLRSSASCSKRGPDDDAAVIRHSSSILSPPSDEVCLTARLAPALIKERLFCGLCATERIVPLQAQDASDGYCARYCETRKPAERSIGTGLGARTAA